MPDLKEHSIYCLTEYYQNNLKPFTQSLSERCLWIGPAEGQMIRTKKALVEIFTSEIQNLTFQLGNLQVLSLPVTNTSIDIILTYSITTFYPDGTSNTFQQRSDLLWVKEVSCDDYAGGYRILICNVSNCFPYDERDRIYPNHFTELPFANVFQDTENNTRIPVKGLHNTVFFLTVGTILWMTSQGTHTLIHTTTLVYESTEVLSSLSKRFSDSLIRVHSCYTVNPKYIASIARCYCLMKDGERIPIPEKRFTAIREELNKRMNK